MFWTVTTFASSGSHFTTVRFNVGQVTLLARECCLHIMTPHQVLLTSFHFLDLIIWELSLQRTVSSHILSIAALLRALDYYH